jgi:hypothetical protein
VRHLTVAVIVLAVLLTGGVIVNEIVVSIFASLVVATLFILLQARRRVPVEFRRRTGKYVLKFSDLSYAEKVATLNGAKVKVKTGADAFRREKEVSLNRVRS